jgi:hypothetical protein
MQQKIRMSSIDWIEYAMPSLIKSFGSDEFVEDIKYVASTEHGIEAGPYKEEHRKSIGRA